MISVIITSYNEPDTIGRAIESFLSQDINSAFEIIVSCPDDATANIVKRYKKVKLFRDAGKGKNHALNQLLSNVKGDIIVLSDGDVFIGSRSLKELIRHFNNKNVGVVAGRPVSLNDKKNKLGYWSHLLADAGAHKIRNKLCAANKFVECSAYLFAFRNKTIKKIPVDVAEDAIIPYFFHRLGYRVLYEPKAVVYVKNPDNISDWLAQRKRTANAHTKLTRYARDFPRVKSFSNELLYSYYAWTYPKSFRELWWTFQLFIARLYMWLSLFNDLRFKGRHYNDKWKRIESTK
jgi:cellulose synthase/poly-beta-1,6-N-acetylglucosamine synthase-like glycosyltransferase